MPKQLTIVFVTPEYVTEKNFDGGLANYVHRVALALKDMGHRPIVLVASDVDEFINHANLEVFRVNVNSKIINAINLITGRVLYKTVSWIYRSWRMQRALNNLCVKESIDLIQYPSYQAMGFFRVKKRPSVVRVSSVQSLLRSVNGQLLTLDERISDFLERKSMIIADKCFTPSHFLAKYIDSVLHFRPDVIKPPFILEPMKEDDSLYREFLSSKKYLIFFGSMNQLKGLVLISEIIFDLLIQHRDLHFVFVGKDTGMFDFVKSHALTEQDRLIHFEKLPHSQLYPLIKGAYAVVLPSLVDNLPNSCIEAMWHKKIVIGLNDTSFEELIIDGENGFLADKNSVSLLYKINTALSLVIQKKEKIQDNARKTISVNLGSDTVVPQLINLYTMILK